MARRLSASAEGAAADPALAVPIPPGKKVDRNALMPGYRVRHDGWTTERTQRFLDTLAHTGCVRDAARVAGVSNVAGYRLKNRFPAFAAAWDEALERSQQGLVAIAYKRAVEGKETVIIHKGEEVERRIAPSDAMLGLLLKRGDTKGGDTVSAEKAITLAEWKQKWRFDESGKKVQQSNGSEGDVRLRLQLRFSEMRERMLHDYLDSMHCPTCKAALARWQKERAASAQGGG